MTNMRIIEVVVNVITAEVFCLFFLALIILNKTKSITQRSFMVWILSLGLVGMLGAAYLSTTNAEIALLLVKTHFSILQTGAVAIWLFALQFRRELRISDMFYLIPYLIVIPILWSVSIDNVRLTTIGWDVVSTPWFSAHFIVLFGYYLAAFGLLFVSYLHVRRTGDIIPARKLGILAGSVLALTAIGCFVAIASRVLHSEGLTIVLEVAYIFPPIIMAWSFRLGDESRSVDYSR